MEETRSFSQALEEVNLDELTLRLGLYTHRRLARMFWRGESKGPIPGGWEPADFVQAAFKKGLTGIRVWKSSNHSLFDFLKDIISSDISNLALKSENRVESRVTTAAGDAGSNLVSTESLPGNRSEWPDTGSFDENEVAPILQRVGENDFDQKVVRCVLEMGMSVSSEIAAELKVPVNDVYKSKKRLRRRFQYLRAMSANESPDSSGGLRDSLNREAQECEGLK